MDFPVLKYLDILIGLSVVMLLVSTIVMAVTQAVLNGGFARARHLRRGLIRLIAQLDREGLRDHAPYLADALQRHPLIGQSTMFDVLRRLRNGVRNLVNRWADPLASVTWALPDHRLLLPISPGAVVQREELILLLIELAANESPVSDPNGDGQPPTPLVEAQKALQTALQRTGVEDPAATLRAIRLKAMENERARPEQPAARWRAEAVADAAPTDFVARLHANFDSTMARVTDAFTMESKLWASAAAFGVAFALQLDAFALVTRLAVDEKMRAELVAVAQAEVNRTTAEEAKVPKEASTSTAGANAAPAEDNTALAAATSAKVEATRALDLLRRPAIDLIPKTLPSPLGEGKTPRGAWPGILFSWLLLSLGAPFWFDALKNLLKLRSLLAKKDDADRERRVEAQPPAAQTTPAPPPAPPTPPIGPERGEDGDLAATGAAG